MSLRVAVATAALAGLTVGARTASADVSVIKRPGLHPRYSFEAEPHLLVGVLDPVYDDSGLGLGFRGTIPIVDPGFVPSINDTVGIGFGADWIHHGGAYRDCVRFETGQGNADRCVEYQEQDADDLFVPVVMQWNFFLTRSWSVFGEPGVGLHLRDPGKDRFRPLIMYAGGRWHFADRASLTVRLGWPTASVGVSFLL